MMPDVRLALARKSMKLMGSFCGSSSATLCPLYHAVDCGKAMLDNWPGNCVNVRHLDDDQDDDKREDGTHWMSPC